MMTNTRKNVLTALFACAAMGLYALESCIPPVVPVPGVKLGLSNIVTLVVFYTLGKRAAFAQLGLRILMTALLFGHVMTLAFSVAGGVMSFAAVCVCAHFADESQLWATGVFAALAHNAGQVIMAVLITEEITVAYYFLVLIISSVITGIFTGMCAKYCVRLMNKTKLLQNI